MSEATRTERTRSLNERIIEALETARQTVGLHQLPDLEWNASSLTDAKLEQQLTNLDGYITAVTRSEVRHGPIDTFLSTELFAKYVSLLSAGIIGIVSAHAAASESPHAGHVVGSALLATSELIPNLPRRLLRYGVLCASLAAYDYFSGHWCDQFALNFKAASVGAIGFLGLAGIDASLRSGTQTPAKQKEQCLDNLYKAKEILESLRPYSVGSRHNQLLQRRPITAQTKRKEQKKDRAYKSIAQTAMSRNKSYLPQKPSPDSSNTRQEQHLPKTEPDTKVISSEEKQVMSDSSLESALQSDLGPADSNEVVPDLASREQRLYQKLVHKYGARSDVVLELIKQEGTPSMLRNLKSIKEALPKEAYKLLIATNPAVLAQPKQYYVALGRVARALVRQDGDKKSDSGIYRNLDKFATLEGLTSIEDGFRTEPVKLSDKLDMLNPALRDAGYEPQLVYAVLIEGLELLSNTARIGERYINERHFKNNMRKVLESHQVQDAYSFAASLMAKGVITTKKSNQVYRLNPHWSSETSDSALRAYLGHAFELRKNLKS